MKQFKIITLSLALFCAFLQTAGAQDMTAKQKANIQAAYDALNRKDFTAFASLCAPDYVEQNVAPTPTKGINAAIELYKQFFTAFPDFMIKINEIAPSGVNRYLLRVTITGTNTGSFMGLPATGKSIKFDDADVVVLNADGKCISHQVTNVGEPLRQIGYGSLTNPNTNVIMEAYGNFGKHDVAAIQAQCADDVVFELQDRMFDSKARWFKGKDGVGKFFQEIGSKFQYTKFQPVRFVADGDDVFILVDAEYKLSSTGKTYSSTYTHHFVVKNGKIAYFRGVDDFQMEK